MYSPTDSKPRCLARISTKRCMSALNLTVTASVFLPSMSGGFAGWLRSSGYERATSEHLELVLPQLRDVVTPVVGCRSVDTEGVREGVPRPVVVDGVLCFHGCRL